MFTTQQSINSATPSPPPITILPGSPPTTPQSTGNEEKENLLVANHNHPTIAEEQHEHDDVSVMNKSSLSLPFEHSPTTPLPVTTTVATNNSVNHVKVSLPERSQSDRRKLSVTNIMSFGERRRSTSSIFSDMRKMSITNFDNLKSPGVGEKLSHSFLSLSFPSSDLAQSIFLLTATPGVPTRTRPSSKMTKYVECWGADKPFANITDSKMAKNIGLAVSFRSALIFCLSRLISIDFLLFFPTMRYRA